MARKELLLSGDIGGTNTRLRLVEVIVTDQFVRTPLASLKSLPGTEIHSQKYQNEFYDSMIDVLKLFLKEAGSSTTPAAACLAVAGPVNNQIATLTNRASWIIDGAEISKKLDIASVRIVNDFLAMGYGLLTLDVEKECVTLQGAEPRKDAPIACIGAGTGLGECFLTPNGFGGYECFASEGGHAEFAPKDEVEMKLFSYLKGKFGHKKRISVERIVSGPGLANVYEFLCHEYPDFVDKVLHEEILKASDADRGRLIATNATRNPACEQTMLIFTSNYGSEAGVAGLKWLPYGGLYLTGGLTPKNIDYLTGKAPGSQGLFMDAMLDKGRVSSMLHSIPVYAVMADDLGERGAQYTALRLLQASISATSSPTTASYTTTAAGAAAGAAGAGGSLAPATAAASVVSTTIMVMTTAVISGALSLANHHWLHPWVLRAWDRISGKGN